MRRDAGDATVMRLVYANQTEEDILLKRELDEMAKDNRFEVHYICSRPQARFILARGQGGQERPCRSLPGCQAVHLHANSMRAWLRGEVWGGAAMIVQQHARNSAAVCRLD